MEEKVSRVSRRDIFKAAAAGGVGLIASKVMADGEEAEANAPVQTGKSMIGVPFKRHEQVRVGIIGVGARGSGLIGDFAAVPGVKVNAICDIDKSKVLAAQKGIMARGQSEPAGYWKGERDFENLCKRDDLDLVIIATPWNWHVPMALSAMKNGHHAAVEVPVAVTMKECWDIVNVSEETQKHCIILENCCYGYNEMMVWNMVKDGLLGDLTHAECAYIHDLRSLLCASSSEGLWRRDPHFQRNGNFYPTHGLGPVCNYFDVNRGDRMEYLVSMSSPEASLTEYVEENFKADDPKRKEKYICGDINTSLIKCASGKSIMLQHDVVTPRPYSRINMVQGSAGTFCDYPARLALDAEESHDWLKPERYNELKSKYEHDIWKRVGEMARANGGHGGMDFIMAYRLIECMKLGIAPDMDVYDAADWSAPTPLSQDSVKKGSAPMKFPDFTRGRWKERRKIWQS